MDQKLSPRSSESLGKFSNRYNHKSKPYHFLTNKEKRRFCIIEREKLKQKNDYRIKSKFLKNVDFENKYLSIINKPQTPHNTGQYIAYISNNRKNEADFIDDFELRELCISGSMMKPDIDDEMNFDFDNYLPQDIYSKRKRFMSFEKTEEKMHQDYINKNDEYQLPENALEIKKISSFDSNEQL